MKIGPRSKPGSPETASHGKLDRMGCQRFDIPAEGFLEVRFVGI